MLQLLEKKANLALFFDLYEQESVMRIMLA
jgi:hypothetical protein